MFADDCNVRSQVASSSSAAVRWRSAYGAKPNEPRCEFDIMRTAQWTLPKDCVGSMILFRHDIVRALRVISPHEVARVEW